MKQRKKLLAVLLTISCFMAMNLSVLAAEPAAVPEPKAVEAEATDDSNVAVPASVLAARSIYGYAADYTNYDSDSFTVNAPGSATSTGGATIKSSDFSTNLTIYVNIYRPDGTLAVSNVKLTGNQEKVVSFSNAQPGNYTVSYGVYGTAKGWIHCWIY